MVEIPKAIDIEIRDKDIRGDLSSIIESMSRIRFEAINNKSLSNERKEEYMHLTYRLASIMKGLVTEGMIDNLQFLAKSMDKHEPLLFYDPMQDGYWENTAPEFIEALDKAVTQIMGDRCTSLDYKHHIAQAVKYLGSQSEGEERRNNIITTIAPLYGHVRGDARQLFNAQYINQFCRGKGFDFSRDFSLRLPNASDIIASAVMTAKQLGYLTIEVGVTKNEYEEIEKRFPGVIPEETRSGILEKLLGKKDDQRVLIKIPVNKAPTEPDAQDYFGFISGFLENKSLMEYVMTFKPGDIGNLLSNYDENKLRDFVFKELNSRGLRIDPSKIEIDDGINSLAQKAKEMLQHQVRYPDIFGFLIGDHIRINNLVNKDGDDNEDYLWKGSEGEIVGIDTTVSIEFFEVRGPRKSKRRNLEGKIWDIETEHLKIINKSSTEFPDWYKKHDINIGDTVEVKKSYSNEYELDKDDVCPGSKGKVIGYVYTVNFKKLVDKTGKSQEKTKRDDGLNQIYLERTDAYDEAKIDSEINNIIIRGFEQMAARDSKLVFDFVKHRDAFGYVNIQDIGRYHKYTWLINYNGTSYAMSFICKDSEMDYKDVIKAVINKKKVIRDAFADVVMLTNATYAHITEYQNSKKVDEIEIVA